MTSQVTNYLNKIFKRLNQKSDPRFTDGWWREQIEMMLEIGKKSEQQSLAKYGLDFVTDTYLPKNWVSWDLPDKNTSKKSRNVRYKYAGEASKVQPMAKRLAHCRRHHAANWYPCYFQTQIIFWLASAFDK